MKWLDLPGYIGQYQVSDCGQVRSLSREVDCSTAMFKRTRKVPAKFIKQRMDRYGYLTVGLNKCGKVKWYKVHRLIMFAFVGVSKLTVNHKDFDKTNNKLNNLEYMTIAKNTAHFNEYNSRKVPTGSKHFNSKLSDKQRAEIYNRYKNGEKPLRIVIDYPIKRNYIYKVIKNYEKKLSQDNC